MISSLKIWTNKDSILIKVIRETYKEYSQTYLFKTLWKCIDQARKKYNVSQRQH